MKRFHSEQLFPHEARCDYSVCCTGGSRQRCRAAGGLQQHRQTQLKGAIKESVAGAALSWVTWQITLKVVVGGAKKSLIIPSYMQHFVAGH